MTFELSTHPPQRRIYTGEIPAFVENSIDELYGSLYSSLPQLALGGLNGVNTYVEEQDGRLLALFLYVREGRSIRVINEGMDVAPERAEIFAETLLAREPQIDSIVFRAIRLNGMPAGRPAFSVARTEDIVLDLPADEPAYMALLGKATRKTLRQNLSRAKHLEFAVIPGPAVDAGLFDAIVAFNHARMAGKLRRSAVDAQASADLLSLVRARGLAGIARLDGRLCAGTLACRIGQDLYSLLNAHDPSTNAIGMGNLVRHLMIVAAIRDGMKRFHLLGGHFPSKRSSGAVRVPLPDLLIYRDRRSMLADIGRLASLSAQAAAYRIRCGVEDEEARARAPWPERAAAKLARRLRDALRWRRARRAAPTGSGIQEG